MKLNTIITSVLGLTISISAMAKTNNISKRLQIEMGSKKSHG